MSDRPYRFVGRLKNNRMWSAILETFDDVQTQADASAHLGVSQSELCAILNMRLWPMGKTGWLKSAKRISETLGLSCEYLFDPVLYGKAPPRQIEVELTPALSLPDRAPTPFDVVSDGEQREAVSTALQPLGRNAREVLQRRYGLDPYSVEQTPREVGRALNLSHQRIRQIERAAIGRLRRGEVGQLREFVRGGK